MARIRSIKPEFAHSESMGKVSRDARLLFVLMWTIADDEGRLRGSSRMLASLLFPYDSDAPKRMDGWVAELEREHCIVRYEVDGSSFIEIRKWASHQRIDHASKSRIPSFDSIREASRGIASDSERSFPIQIPSGEESVREGGAKKSEKRASRVSVPRPETVSEEAWQAWLVIRKGPVTALALKALEREAGAAGMTLEAAVIECAERGWQSLKASWMRDRVAGPGPRTQMRNLDGTGRRVVHPDRMPIPYNSPTGDCFCEACVNARAKRQGASA